MMKLRQATREECPQIFSYVQKLAQHEGSTSSVQTTLEDLEQFLFEQRVAEAFLVEYQAEVVGFVVISNNFSTYLGKPTLFLEDLYLDSAVRGLGLGKQVLGELQQLARERGYGRIEWTCLDDNHDAKQFYQQQGAQALTDKTLYRITIK